MGEQTFSQARDSHARDASVEPSSPAAYTTLGASTSARPTLASQPSNKFVPAPAISSLVQHPPASSPALGKGDDEDPLAAAQREIERLKQQLTASSASTVTDPSQATGLRKRTTGVAAEKADSAAGQVETAVQQIVHTGVSLPTVVAIAFGVFVFTYLFF